MKHLSGPITIGKIAGKSAKYGISSYLGFLALLSISLGIMNLLPVPVLDGGHLLSFAYEAITRRKPNKLFIHYSALLAISALLTLMVFVSFNDIIRIMLFWK